MTNLERVVNLVKTTKIDRKATIKQITTMLNVSSANAAVYYSKAIKIVNPQPVKVSSIPKEEVVLVSKDTNERIASIIDKANNYVVTL